MDLHPEIFTDGALKEEIRSLLLRQLHGAGLPEHGFSAYLVGDLATPLGNNFTPMQVVVCINDADAGQFNESIGKYLKSLELKSLGRKLEFAFQNGVVNLSDHPAVYDLINRVWFKHFSPRKAQTWSKAITIDLGVAKGIPLFEAFLKSNGFTVYVLTPLLKGRVEVEVMAADEARFLDLVQRFVGNNKAPTKAPEPDRLLLRTEQPQGCDWLEKVLPARISSWVTRFLRTNPQTISLEMDPKNAGKVKQLITDIWSKEYAGIDHLRFGERILQATPSKRAASAFIKDVRYGDLPKQTQKDVSQFLDCKPGDLFAQYGMVVSELLPKADPHNLESAKEHCKDIPERKLTKEVYDKMDDKFILLLNDRIIDGHHFLAKAERAGVTRTLRVLDLTPHRFQRRASQLSNHRQSSLSNRSTCLS